MRDVIEKYFGERKNYSMAQIIVVYSLMFIVLMLFTYFLFFVSGKSPFQFKVDGLTYFSRMAYLGDLIRNVIKNIFIGHTFSLSSIYDFRIGLGDDIFVFLWVGLLNPIIWLVAPLFPVDSIEGAYWLLSIIHIYLAGISFILFCRYKKIVGCAPACAAIVYVFSGFPLFYFVKHFSFIVPMILLPLMLIALERLLEDRKVYFLIFITTISILINFYFTFMITLMMLVYGVARFFDIYHDNRIKTFCSIFIRGFVSYLIAILLAAPFFFPVVFKVIDSPRVTNVVSSSSIFLYSKLASFHNLTYLFAPGGSWGRSSMIPICLLALFCLLRRRLLDKGIAALLLILILGLLSPSIGYLINACAYTTDRWMFLIPFVFAYIFAMAYPYILEWRSEDKMASLWAVLGYSTFLLFGYLSGIQRNWHVPAYFASVAMLMFTVFASYGYSKFSIGFRGVLLILTVLFFSGANVWFLYTYNKYIDTFDPANEAVKAYKKSLLPLLCTLDTPSSTNFFRSDTSNVSNFAFYLLDKQYNLAGYTSLLAPAYPVSHIELENTGMLHMYLIKGVDNISSLETLASVKYFVLNNNIEDNIPFGFSKVAEDSEQKRFFFKNEMFLPLGYTYDNYILQEEYQRFSAVDKLESQRQTVALNIDGSINCFPQKQNLVFTNMNLPIKMMTMDGCTWDKGVLRVNRKGAEIKLSVISRENAEMYLRLQGFSVDKAGGEARFFGVPVKVNGRGKTFHVVRDTDPLYNNRKNFLINLGSSRKSEELKISVTWPIRGTFKLEDIQIYAQPMDDYPEQIEKLREDVLENINVGNDKVSGTISLKKNKILCLSIPYSKGWHAKVDGKAAELLKANSLFMALPLEAGDHKIELEYRVPGFRLGLCFFALGVAILGVMMFIDRRKRRQKAPQAV